jgi:hypothetical protein
MSHQKRLDDLEKHRGFQLGPGRDEANIRFWQNLASENSQIAPRASDGPMKLPSTKQTVRDTAMRPFESRKIDRLMKGEEPSDKNDAGSSYMKGIRRTT